MRRGLVQKEAGDSILPQPDAACTRSAKPKTPDKHSHDLCPALIPGLLLCGVGAMPGFQRVGRTAGGGPFHTIG